MLQDARMDDATLDALMDDAVQDAVLDDALSDNRVDARLCDARRRLLRDARWRSLLRDDAGRRGLLAARLLRSIAFPAFLPCAGRSRRASPGALLAWHCRHADKALNALNRLLLSS